MKLLALVGTRPNLVKMAPVVRCLRQRPGTRTLLVHSGQHFDRNMSQVFFEDLAMPAPDHHLGIGGLSPWAQTGRLIAGLGELIAAERPDWVVVPGDVNSTLAGAVAAVRCDCRLAHLESGLRSFDRSMPEERNRVATDHLADLLFVTEPSGLRNLKAEGIAKERIHFVGNTMIDTLVASRALAERSDVIARLGLGRRDRFTLMTMHRPATVDHRQGLGRLGAVVEHAAARGPVVWPLHPRTRERLEAFDLLADLSAMDGLVLTAPLGYLDFLALLMRARVVLTDSGGIQEETTALGTACLTLRDNTERPITCTEGTNRLVGTAPAAVAAAFDEVWKQPPAGRVPEGWDGRAAERVADVFAALSTS